MKKVGILMGSDSDARIMKEAWQTLDELSIGWEARVLSAHRTPDEALNYAKNAENNDIGVIIAGAGGAAHLPGVLAAVFRLPVIGVPISSGLSTGMDSILSILQMPKGIPVATVGLDNAKNAALLAGRILSISDPEVRSNYEKMVLQMAETVKQKDAALKEKIANDEI
jgi:5-(carboxyamino)imidazole ribonucleotide mutase